MSLVTYDMVRRELDLKGDDEQTRNWIEDRIARIGEQLTGEKWCGQRLEYGTLTIVNQARSHASTFLLPYVAVASVASVSYRDDEFASWTAFDASEYVLLDPEDESDLYRLCLKSVVAGRWYQLVLNVGYWPADNDASPPAGVQTVPRALQGVVIDMIAYDYDQAFGNRRGLLSKSSTPGGTSTSYVTREAKEAEWHRALAPFRRARRL